MRRINDVLEGAAAKRGEGARVPAQPRCVTATRYLTVSSGECLLTLPPLAFPTLRSPLRHFGLDKPGMKIGVAGLGGLGHMAVKIAAAMG